MFAFDATFWRDRRVFVTGHTGFKGAWLVLWLTGLGARVTGLSLPPHTDPSLFALCAQGRCTDRYGDIADPAIVVRALADFPNLNSAYAVEDGKPVVVRHEHVNLGLAVDHRERTVFHEGRAIWVRSYPISIDVGEFESLLEHPAVSECGVVGAPDAERGTIVKAYVVLKSGNEADEQMKENLQEHVKNAIAPYKYPRAVEFVGSLPRTETGKLQRFKLRKS